VQTGVYVKVYIQIGLLTQSLCKCWHIQRRPKITLSGAPCTCLPHPCIC